MRKKQPEMLLQHLNYLEDPTMQVKIENNELVIAFPWRNPSLHLRARR